MAIKFTATADISAPIADVFERMCDAGKLEQTVRQRGGTVRRTPEGPLQTGTTWDARIAFGGAARDVSFTLAVLHPPVALRLKGRGAAFEISVDVELIALGPASTRLSVATEGLPQTLAARLMAQSLKFTYGQMLARYRQRISEYAAEIEQDCRPI